jgi:hypothetical protein
MTGRALVGTAGWSLPSRHAADFPTTGSHLERYATRFDVVEINSSFYRPHRLVTYDRWAASVPDDFRFRSRCRVRSPLAGDWWIGSATGDALRLRKLLHPRR